jgi:transposase
MNIATLWAQRRRVQVESVVITNESIAVVIRAISRRSRCPQCQRAMRRVHSRYRRHVTDMPVQGRVVQLFLHVRRFFCDRRACPQRIFCERVSALVAPSSRRTRRLAEALMVVGFALGGKPGAQLAQHLGMPTSPDTVLRCLRHAPLPRTDPPRVVGIDDWAFKRGRSYGTPVVDLERRCPIDLLPDREAATVAQWFKSHPGVQIVSRDRAGAYADGVRQGAPDAIQVADRWHLVRNLVGAFERFLHRHHPQLRQAAQSITAKRQAAALPVSVDPPPARSASVASSVARDRRVAQYVEVQELVRQGLSWRAIARQLRLHRQTVRHFATAAHFPERRVPAPRQSGLTPFVPLAQQRWAASGQNAAALWRALQQQGFHGSYYQVWHLVSHWRGVRPTAGRYPQGAPACSAVLPFLAPSPRTAVWWLLHALVQQPAEWTMDQQEFVAQFLTLCAPARQVQELVLEFAQLLREQQGDKLEVWLAQARASAVPELVGFANGIARDQAAVRAACTSVWSNGQLEGQVNRVKLLKRQMFGRANFDLLKLRVLHTRQRKTKSEGYNALHQICV